MDEMGWFPLSDCSGFTTAWPPDDTKRAVEMHVVSSDGHSTEFTESFARDSYTTLGL
jgi:hypothetical protein